MIFATKSKMKHKKCSIEECSKLVQQQHALSPGWLRISWWTPERVFSHWNGQRLYRSPSTRWINDMNNCLLHWWLERDKTRIIFSSHYTGIDCTTDRERSVRGSGELCRVWRAGDNRYRKKKKTPPIFYGCQNDALPGLWQHQVAYQYNGITTMIELATRLLWISWIFHMAQPWQVLLRSHLFDSMWNCHMRHMIIVTLVVAISLFWVICWIRNEFIRICFRKWENFAGKLQMDGSISKRFQPRAVRRDEAIERYGRTIVSIATAIMYSSFYYSTIQHCQNRMWTRGYTECFPSVRNRNFDIEEFRKSSIEYEIYSAPAFMVQ